MYWFSENRIYQLKQLYYQKKTIVTTVYEQKTTNGKVGLFDLNFIKLDEEKTFKWSLFFIEFGK